MNANNTELINRQVKEHETNVSEWEYSGVVKELYKFFALMNLEFFEKNLPTPVITFEQRGRSSLGHYVVGRNSMGAKENININPVHLNRKKTDILSTLLHELVHSWQLNYGSPGKGNYHNKECREKMRQLGIPCDNWGCTISIQDPFVSFLRKNGIEEDEMFKMPCKSKPKKGSKLKKWTCKCGYGVRVAIKNFNAKCLECGEQFMQVD